MTDSLTITKTELSRWYWLSFTAYTPPSLEITIAREALIGRTQIPLRHPLLVGIPNLSPISFSLLNGNKFGIHDILSVNTSQFGNFVFVKAELPKWQTGEGGIIVVNNEALSATLRSLSLLFDWLKGAPESLPNEPRSQLMTMQMNASQSPYQLEVLFSAKLVEWFIESSRRERRDLGQVTQMMKIALEYMGGESRGDWGAHIDSGRLHMTIPGSRCGFDPVPSTIVAGKGYKGVMHNCDTLSQLGAFTVGLTELHSQAVRECVTMR